MPQQERDRDDDPRLHPRDGFASNPLIVRRNLAVVAVRSKPEATRPGPAIDTHRHACPTFRIGGLAKTSRGWPRLGRGINCWTARALVRRAKRASTHFAPDPISAGEARAGGLANHRQPFNRVQILSCSARAAGLQSWVGTRRLAYSAGGGKDFVTRRIQRGDLALEFLGWIEIDLPAVFQLAARHSDAVIGSVRCSLPSRPMTYRAFALVGHALNSNARGSGR